MTFLCTKYYHTCISTYADHHKVFERERNKEKNGKISAFDSSPKKQMKLERATIPYFISTYFVLLLLITSFPRMVTFFDLVPLRGGVINLEIN